MNGEQGREKKEGREDAPRSGSRAVRCKTMGVLPRSSTPIVQTVDKDMRQRLDRHGGIVKGGGEPPFTFNPSKKGNFFGSSLSCCSSCRHFVDSLNNGRAAKKQHAHCTDSRQSYAATLGQAWGDCEGGRGAPLHVQSKQERELFRKFPFLLFKLSTLCRQLEQWAYCQEAARPLYRYWISSREGAESGRMGLGSRSSKSRLPLQGG